MKSDEPVGVHIVSLGCARNEVDSEELAARLEAGGFRLVDEPEDAHAVMVNTCGFIEAAKQDSINTLLEAADLKDRALKVGGRTQAVVAVGCMAERYGAELADSLTETDAVLGFDDYTDIAERLTSILGGAKHQAHVPRDRRTLLPLSPAARQGATVATPGHGEPDLDHAGPVPASGPRTLRRRLGHGPMAPLKLASGCDRRCTFCAIPSFRGAYLSRPAEEILAEARWLTGQGVRELFLVSENSTSYGKDLGDIGALEKLLPRLAEIEELEWIRVSYLQPAELRPGLVEAMTATDKVAAYFDLSFQHASPAVLRRMRRFGDPKSFLDQIATIRELAPYAGIRSNFIAGFPGETDDDVAMLAGFLSEARLDAIGVFGYSNEEGTEAERLDAHLDDDVIERRRRELTDLAEELVDQRAAERVGERVRVLIEEVDQDVIGRAEHQGPEVDGCCTMLGGDSVEIGDLVDGVVVDSDGVDLIVEVIR